MPRKKVLPNLPPSEDSFWDHADKELLKEIISVKEGCDHHFIHRTAQEVECKFCHTGYFLDNYCEVRDGHIYRDGVFVI